MLYGQARGRPDQASTRQFHDKRPCVMLFPGQVMGRPGGAESGEGLGGEERGHKEEKEAGGGSKMVNVQCLDGPLLWVTESEMFRKAERIRLKDLSERDETSSDVIPFVSIFGRIFNLMVPAEAQNFAVRSAHGTSRSFLHTDRDSEDCLEEMRKKIKDNQAELPELNCFSFRR